MNNIKPKLMSIRKIARVRDDATGQYTEVIEFSISRSTTAQLELAPAKIHDVKAFSAQLRNAGAVLPPDSKHRIRLLRAVANSKAPKELVYAAQTGWLDDKCEVFVKADGVIGKTYTNIIGINPKLDVDDQSGRLSKAGTWQSWKAKVAPLASLSSIFMFEICVAFAAPLLRIIQCQSFSICIVGRSRIGKTVATLLGASVRGIARTGDLITWNITEDRLEQRLVEYNDSIFPIDDLNKMRGKDWERFKRIEGVAYLVEQGHQKGRYSSFAKAHGAARKWRVILVTSNELSTAELANKLNEERRQGAAVRLNDVPGTLGGLKHIFDGLKEPIDGPSFRRWSRTQFANIALVCAENHGAVFDYYIDRVIFHGREKVRRYVLKKIDFFVDKVVEETDGDIARDVARNFGLVYAGGMLGSQLAILPWTPIEIFEAIAKCYRAARELLPDDGVALRRGIAALIAKLRELSSSHQIGDGADYDSIDGFRERERTTIRYLIKCEALNAEFASRRDQRLVLDWLIETRRLTPAMPKSASVGLNAKPKIQHEWPDGKRRRSYEIRWPRKSKTGNTAAKRRKA
jgi:putative DNA primase/helicase